MRRTYLSFFASIVVPLALYACADDDNTPPGPKTGIDAAAVDSGGGDTGVDAPIDQGAKVPVRCTQAELDAADKTGDMAVQIAFPTGPGPAQYTNNCIKVKAGTTKVTFTGSFQSHPLEPNGGDTPTQIPTLQRTGTTLDITFTTAGTFGYECNIHPGVMYGAIQVVP